MRQHPRVLRAAVVLTGALLTVGAFAIAGWTGAKDKPGPGPMTESSPILGPGETPEPAPSSVPAALDDPSGCAAGRRAFRNPVMHYRLCYPQGWGFSDFTRAGPLDRIPSVQLENLHLLSPEAFPWNVGDYPFDAVVAKNAIDAELNLLQPGAKILGECTPKPTQTEGILSCRQAYDTTGQPAETGPVTAVKFVVPLLRAPASPNTDLDLEGSKLLVVVRTSTLRAAKEVDLGWELVRSITPY